MNELDIFDDDDGLLQQPTMRGNANLDIQDYQGGEDGGDLLEEIQEDVPSTPGSGAAPAPDVDGTSEYEMADDEGGPGMNQTTYGSSPWGPGSETGYQPMSMRATDLSGSEEQVNPAPRDPQMNPEPSNRGVDPLTIYDRSSYEFNDSEQDTIGSGVFSNEEGATFRARDGQFAHQYALPEYIANEDELGVEQSDMWDETAENWRVVQPSGGGVTFSRRVDRLKPGGRAYSPFAQGGGMPEMRPDVKGPKSHVEAFGRKVAVAIIGEARSLPPQSRGAFLNSAVAILGPNMAEKCKRTAERLTTLGYQPETALEDAIAHCVMHATVEDLTKGRGSLPRLDRLTGKVRGNGPALRGAAQQHVAPLLADQRKLRGDLGALYNSAAAAGMGEVAQEAAPAAPAASIIPIISNRNLAIAAAAAGALFVFSQTETGQKLQANVGRSAKRAWRQVRRAARRK